MKKLFSAIIVMILSLCIVCAANADAVRVASLKGPTAMGMVQMMNENNGSYEFSIHAAIDEITPKIVKGELDIAAVPANLASVLYNNTQGKVKVLAINTLGVIYIVENGNSISCVDDLKGKTLYASGKGATPEYALNYILQGNGIDPQKDINIEYKSEHSECLASLLADEGSVAMLPQPFVTTAMMKQPSVRIVFGLTEAWDEIAKKNNIESSLLTGVMIVRSDFANENPEAVERFMQDYRASVAYTNENVEEAAKLVAQFDIVPEAVAKVAIPYCHIVCIEGDDMQNRLGGYLQVLFEQEPRSVGGAMPDEDFYYNH